MLRLKRYFTISAITTPGASVAAYVPFLLAARGLAFFRLLLVAKILGDVGQHEYGLYRPAQELINPLVALVMFGAADVAERYASWIEKKEGGAGLGRWLGRQYLRLIAGAGVAGLIMCALGPWISLAVWGERATGLVAACAVTVLLLAVYQHLAAVLRGLRAYSAAAGMELLGALLLMLFSIVAAIMGHAVTLVLGYAASIFIPVVLYGALLWAYLKQLPTPAPVNMGESLDISAGADDAIPYARVVPTADAPPRMNRFAAWALVRLMLVMTFGFLSLWGVRYLAAHAGTASKGSAPATQQDVLRATADYAMAYTIAQLLAYVAVMLWASTYGIAARAWSHGQIHRARVQIFRVGKFGGVMMVLAALVLLLGRGLFAAVMPPAYANGINSLLPGLLALFIWYGLLAFCSTYADLQEKPQRGAAIWGVAVAIQAGGILLARFRHVEMDAREYILVVSAVGLAAALMAVAPLLLCRPFRFTATGVPLVILALAPVALFAPEWVVGALATPILLGAVAFLYASGLLIRPIDKRAIRKLWRTRIQRGLPVEPTNAPSDDSVVH